MGQGVGHGGGAAGHVEFGEDVLDVVLGGAPADVQGLADAGVGGAVGEQSQDLELAWAEGGAVRIGAGALARLTGTGPGGGPQRGYAFRVEAVFAGEVGRAVAGPFGPDVGGGEHPGADGYGRASEPERIA